MKPTSILEARQESQLIAMAWASPEFETQLLNDPRAVIKHFFDTEFEGVIQVPERPYDLENDEYLNQLALGDGETIVPINSCSCRS